MHGGCISHQGMWLGFAGRVEAQHMGNACGVLKFNLTG